MQAATAMHQQHIVGIAQCQVHVVHHGNHPQPRTTRLLAMRPVPQQGHGLVLPGQVHGSSRLIEQQPARAAASGWLPQLRQHPRQMGAGPLPT